VEYDVHIDPEPARQDRDAILRAVAEMLRQEAERARPSPWRLAGWTDQRVGLTDFDHALPSHRTWPLSTRFAWGGHVFPGLVGRGDAK
jgi:hypothetical protein